VTVHPVVITPGAPPPPSVRKLLVRDVALVARFELAESVRSRLLLVMALLFVGAGALGAWGYTRLIGAIEEKAAAALSAPASERPGATVGRLREAQTYRDFLRFFLRDDAKADYFSRLPPIVVFYGWAAFLFTPWLVLFTSAETIATEVASRAIRFSLLRTSRLSYALGKGLGQLLIVMGVTAVAALVFFVVAWTQLAAFEPGLTALWLLSYWPRVVLFNLPFLAWAMFASMVTASANLARIVSLGGVVLMSIVHGISNAGWLRRGPISESALDLVKYLTPFGHNQGLGYPPGGGLPSDVAVCLALTVIYFAAGYAVLARRDV
jgi:ABC-type transport system involved in multi-copper enzyme maturation permease subunit